MPALVFKAVLPSVFVGNNNDNNKNNNYNNNNDAYDKHDT